ncbi:glycosyltransferase [Aliarcobacter butzleri]|uniref:glycosyltransferase n=1 Tax=Aliarcobacter butzleri TaxID=28197 RepID=UPI001EDBC4CF|nr:glycosyltransferase [Aliarcobacter butzleri]MCG3682338.1 glycosyltransferase [Aliarcobacter butzleri]MCG3688023.1 glycosyltransferase [Aliarcobacter butzleri]MCG3702943.1 glycosyltransferase [Aliarcobacter butzleri]
MNILVYKDEWAYSVVNLFVDNTIYFLKKKGHIVTIIDANSSDAIKDLLDIFNTQVVDLVINFGKATNPILNDGRPLYDAANTTLLAVYVDHPAHHIPSLTENIKNFLCCFNDKQHVDYVNEILPNHHKIAFFLPHGGLKKTFEEDNQIKNLEEYKKQKSIDIVFAGTFNKNITKKWEDIIDYPKYILDEVSEILIHDDYASVHKTFNQVCTKYGIKFSTFGKVQLPSTLVEIIGYVRSVKRVELIKKIAKNGLNITICGNGWESFVKEHKNINYIGALNIKENLELIKKAKVLINVTPNFTDGSHERVFTGMLNNTVVFSDKSRYYDEFFEDEKNILYYSFNSLDEDIEKLKNILKDDKKLYEISQNAYEIANKHHTWENRVDTMLEMVNLSKFMDK